MLVIISCNALAAAQTSDDKTDAKAGNWHDFELSPEAKAAGIDGKMVIGLSVSAEGRGSGIRIYGGPMWPCETEPKNEIEDVREAVKKYLLSAKFEPATKGGRPRSSDIQIIFLLSQRFRKANDYRQIEEDLKKGINPGLADIKGINRFAKTLPKQLMASRNSLSARLSEVQIIVDENGDVISAGGFRTAVTELNEARELACSAKFRPLMLNQKAVRMTGTLMYGLY